MTTPQGGCRLWLRCARDRIMRVEQSSEGSVNAPLFHIGDPRSNQLLASLPEPEWSRLRPALERVVLPVGQLLRSPGVTPTHLYFPTTAVVSLVHATRDGGSAELAVIGREGMIGISLFMGGHFMSGEAVVQVAGLGYRIGAQAAMQEFDRGGAVMNVLLRFTQALIEQVARTAACNRHHTIEQQVCRRLLLGLDRSASQALLMTHESLARLLGVRREGVTQAALRLQNAGAIRYQRGRIDVLDRGQLEHGACECYAAAHADHAKPAARMAMA
jgi:CRP-like cAMP-binding protein